jgi:hypothetical protein
MLLSRTRLETVLGPGVEEDPFGSATGVSSPKLSRALEPVHRGRLGRFESRLLRGRSDVKGAGVQATRSLREGRQDAVASAARQVVQDFNFIASGSHS